MAGETSVGTVVGKEPEARDLQVSQLNEIHM